MSKNKYYFDSENLEFVPIKRTFAQRIYGLSLFLISSVIIGSFITIILLNTDFIDTPKELVQAREIDNYELQLRVLNKKLDQVESTLANIEKRDNSLYRVYFEASPIPEEQRKAGFGGVNRYDYLEGYESSELIVNTSERVDILTKELVFGYISIYAHMSKIEVRRGNKVKRGDLIGYVGNTGRSVAPHLHYEIVKDGRKINPINFYTGSLTPLEFEKLVNQASQENQSLD